MKESFGRVFRGFKKHQNHKVVFVGTADPKAKPNSAPKLLVDVVAPNIVYFLDYRFTVTHRNLSSNPHASVSIMDDREFVGFRLNGRCRPLKSGAEYERVRRAWDKRLNHYLAGRMIERLRGVSRAGKAEFDLPKEFVIMKLDAREASLVKPDRVLRGRF